MAKRDTTVEFYLLINLQNQQEIPTNFRFTRAERELAAAVPFGYAPRKFYQSTHLVLGPVDEGDSKEKFKLKDAEQTPTVAAPPPVEKTAEEIEKEAKMRRLYVAVTSDRGKCNGIVVFNYFMGYGWDNYGRIER